MRATLAVLIVLLVACTSGGGHQATRSPALSPGQSPERSPASSQSPKPPLTSGGVVEYSVANPSPQGATCVGCGTASLSGVVAGPDGNIWYSDSGRGVVGRVTPSGTIAEFKVPATGAGSRSMTVGPDGNIWLVGGDGNIEWIVRVTPQGSVTKFPGPANSGLESITRGPDGNLWFTEFFTSKLGRITPSGTITEFDLPYPDSNPRGIVTGADGSLWFLESGRFHTALARATVTGEVAEFSIAPTGPSDLNPTSIISGPDETLWFSAGREIGRATLSGSITTFQLPGDGMPVSLAAGPDGNIWFTDAPNNSIGRMHPDGTWQEFPLPHINAQPDGMAAGADGRIWFGETGISRIGSIGLTVPAFAQSARFLNFSSAPGTPQTVVVTNPGEAPLSIGAVVINGTDVGAFGIRSDCVDHPTLAVGASCSITVTLIPISATGRPLAAHIAVHDNGTGSPHVIYLMARMPTCRLPIYSTTSSTTIHAATLDVQSGATTNDPNGAFVADGNLVHSVAKPVLTGTLPATFDRAANRWVPAPETAISPDGLRYAYVEYVGPYQGRIHVVDITTGADHILGTPVGSYGILRFAPEGIYTHGVGEGTAPGLALIDPGSGAERSISTTDFVLAVGAGAIWLGTVNKNDPAPATGIGLSPDEVDRRDLATGATAAWLYLPGASLWVEDVAATEVVVRADAIGNGAVWVVTVPNKGVAVANPASGEPFEQTDGAVIDGDRVWVSAYDGIYMWTPTLGAVLVSSVPATVVGTCA